MNNLSVTEKFAEVFHHAGVKLTHQRLTILEETMERRDHPSAEMIFRSVRNRLPTVSLDTVYRTLWLLDDLGLVAALAPEQERIRFDTDPSPHHHFVCTRCGDISDFTDPRFDRLQPPEAVESLGKAERVQVEFRGLCASCQKKPVSQ